MLQYVGCRIFLKQPTGKRPAPGLFAIGARGPLKNRHAHKRALIGIGLPRSRPLTGANKQSDFTKAYRFARFQLKITRLAIAFI
jgi:hypothetical protein